MYEVERDEDAAVMPLVLCRSEGGPYDDEAFTSGWRLGSIAATLAAPGWSAIADSIRPDERLQADLLAMACGYTMDVDHAGEEWLSVTFRRVTADLEGETGSGRR